MKKIFIFLMFILISSCSVQKNKTVIESVRFSYSVFDTGLRYQIDSVSIFTGALFVRGKKVVSGGNVYSLRLNKASLAASVKHGVCIVFTHELNYALGLVDAQKVVLKIGNFYYIGERIQGLQKNSLSFKLEKTETKVEAEKVLIF